MRRWLWTLISALCAAALSVTVNLATGSEDHLWAWLVTLVLIVGGAGVSERIRHLDKAPSAGAIRAAPASVAVGAVASPIASRKEIDSRLEQEPFQARPFDSTGLNVHARPNSQKAKLVLFVHGLSGSGYGTWSEMLSMLFEGQSGDPVDVAVYDYPSGLRAFWRRGANLPFYSSRLADSLRKLTSEYREVYVVAHSLGGLIAESAIREYLNEPTRSAEGPVTRLAALVLFASPRAGSSWALSPFSFVAREVRWLQRPPERASEISQFFSTWVENNTISVSRSREFLLPRYACLASDDKFVNEFSAIFGIPNHQVNRLSGTHTSITKPTWDNHPQIPWLYSIIRDVSDVRAQWRREDLLATRSQANAPIDPQQYLITELWTDPQGTQWAEVYNEVLHDAIRSAVPVYDIKQVPHAPTDLIIGVHHSETVLDQSIRARKTVDMANERCMVNDRLTVGISPVGPGFSSAARQLDRWLPDGHMGAIYIEGAPDADGLRAIMGRWMKLVISRDPRQPRDTSRIGRILELDADLYDDPGRQGYL